jgi:hypothetical protein
LDVQQHCLISLCNLAGVKECAPILVQKGAVASIMRMTSVMKNDQVTRQCAVSLSNLASGSDETHINIVGDGGISAMVELASHGLVVDENEEDATARSTKDDDEWEDVDENKNSLTSMNTVLTRVPPRLLRKIEVIDGIEEITPIFDKVTTKTMASRNDGISTTRNSPPSPELPTLLINTTETLGDGEDDDEEAEDDTLGASQVLELVDKHLSKYKQSSLTKEHFEMMNQLRTNEKEHQNVIVVPVTVKKGRIQYVLENDENERSTRSSVEMVEEVKKEREGEREEGDSTMVEEAKDKVEVTHEDLSSPTTSSPRSGNRDATGRYRPLNDSRMTSLDFERSNELFPKPMQPPINGHGANLTNSLFNDTPSFLGHLNGVLGPIDAQKKSSRPRKQLLGTWPFEN